MSSLALVLAAGYLVGAIPFGYLVGRLKGVDLFQAGSGNIGATNAGRVLGAKFGALVFALDFLKGAVPVAAAVPLSPEAVDAIGSPGALRAAVAGLAFLGHLFPVYLGFRGGKGVATGAGAVCVLVPVAAAAAVGVWLLTLLASRTVSLSSLAAAGALLLVRVLAPHPFAAGEWPVTLFCAAGAALVAAKHRANVRRLLAGTENTVGDWGMRQSTLRTLHVLALGTWFGGAGFFNFVVAPTHNRTFPEVVNSAPNERTANLPLLPPDATAQDKKNLGSALFGAAVGPVFPLYFGMQAICATVALVTAAAWWNVSDGRRVHRRRVWLLAVAAATVAVGWPVSNYVTELRMARLTGDAAAADAFVTWHFVSLGLSVVTVALAGVALAMAAQLPNRMEPLMNADEHRSEKKS